VEWVKTTAKTLPEAIDLALDNLGVDESEAEIVILEEPRQGLFGRMRGTARVEARIKPKPIRPKNERSRNRRARSDDGSRGGSRNKGRDRGGRSDGRKGREGSGSRGEGGERSAGADATGQRGGEGRSRSGSDDRGQRQGRGGRGERSGGQGGGRNGGGRAGSGKADDQQGRTSSGSNGGEAKPSEGATVEEVATHLRTFLTDLSEAFGFDGDVTIDDSEEGTLVGRIEGRHGLLVGPKGRTLDAVQELARISCQRATPSNVRIKIDVGGYREQRAEALAGFAARAADRAVADGVEVALEPMSPADRKSVHDALNGDERVETQSVGAEPRRRVVVVPIAGSDDDEADDEGDDLDVSDDQDVADDQDLAQDHDDGGADDELRESEDGPEDRPVVGEDE
jgi:spoIIIJ-associated protein